MLMNMARYEQETILLFNEEEKTAGIYTHNTKTTKSMDHGDMEALGFQLRDYYEEVE